MKSTFWMTAQEAENEIKSRNFLPEKWLLQTYFYCHEMEERGFAREFDTKEAAEMYARNNMCGHRHTINEIKSCTIKPKPVRIALKCNECGRNFKVSPNAADPSCPKCGGVDWDVE